MNVTTKCVFGTGKIATGEGWEALSYLKIPVHFFCDNNPSRWGKEIVDGIICISPDQLCSIKNVQCYLLMGSSYCDEVEQQLLLMGLTNIIRIEEILYNDRIVDKYYDENFIHVNQKNMDKPKRYPLPVIMNNYGKKAAIYTCITGKYDQINEPIYVNPEVFDYYLISEKKPENLSVFQWIDINSIIPEDVKDDIRRNRYCKILGNELFSEYKYSIYIDGNMCIYKDMKHYFEKIGSTGMALFSHSKYKDCIYMEGVDCIRAKKDSVDVICTQMNRYRKEGMPRHYGLFACGCIVRENNHVGIEKIMRAWWKEVYMQSYRDQLSFTYVLWKNNLTKENIGVLGDSIYNSQEFFFTQQHDSKSSK